MLSLRLLRDTHIVATERQASLISRYRVLAAWLHGLEYGLVTESHTPPGMLVGATRRGKAQEWRRLGCFPLQLELRYV